MNTQNNSVEKKGHPLPKTGIELIEVLLALKNFTCMRDGNWIAVVTVDKKGVIRSFSWNLRKKFKNQSQETIDFALSVLFVNHPLKVKK